MLTAEQLCARIEALHGGADRVPPTIAQLIGAVRAALDSERTALSDAKRLLAERDEARRDLDTLRSALRPGLTPMTAARLEADLVVYKLEERIIAIVVDLVVNQRPPAIVVAHDLVPLVGELEAARAAAAK